MMNSMYSVFYLSRVSTFKMSIKGDISITLSHSECSLEV